MENSILKFTEQFAWTPEIQNADKLKSSYKHFILGGMGGSHLAGGLFHIFRPGINLYIHRDYGLPQYEDDFLKDSLLIASSYSGNTEETLDFADEAYSKGYDVAVITTGGKLLEFAKENNLPYILIPITGIQPRAALGFASLALATLAAPELIPELKEMENALDPENLRSLGREIAQNLEQKTPVIYSSASNRALAYIWKIKMNETAKIPSYYNVFPELNHNEMQGYDFTNANTEMSQHTHFIFLHDSNDNPKIELRMKTLEALYQEKGFQVTSLALEGDTDMEKVFNSIILCDWITLELAKIYQTEPEAVPFIEEFKRRIK